MGSYKVAYIKKYELEHGHLPGFPHVLKGIAAARTSKNRRHDIINDLKHVYYIKKKRGLCCRMWPQVVVTECGLTELPAGVVIRHRYNTYIHDVTEHLKGDMRWTLTQCSYVRYYSVMHTNRHNTEIPLHYWLKQTELNVMELLCSPCVLMLGDSDVKLEADL